MINLYYWPTPNGHKITIFLEEAEIPYQLVPVNIGKGNQFSKEFLSISPNNKIPAIIDTDTTTSVFESGAILLYLAEKTKKFLPHDTRGRFHVLQWLFWQMSGLGPMAGQNHHFNVYASTKIPYAIERYLNETSRLYAVLDNHLKHNKFIAQFYSIADMACYPWIALWERQSQRLSDFPNLERWLHEIAKRPAVVRAYARAKEFDYPGITEEAKKVLFGQNAETIARAVMGS